MGKSTDILVICAIVTLLSSSPSSIGVAAASANGDHHQLGWFPTPVTSVCRGSMAECIGGGVLGEAEEEFEMDSESNRRILATARYISYAALGPNSVPCSRRGGSYYNCQSSGKASPYSRGCSTITRCRG